MNWLTDIFTEQTFLQAVLVLSLISAAGLALGKVRIFGISLGITFVFFAGIIAGHFGLTTDRDMLLVMQNFGLILYIYALGVQVGPGFFSSFKKGGFRLNALALLLLLTGTAMMVIMHWITDRWGTGGVQQSRQHQGRAVPGCHLPGMHRRRRPCG